MCGILGAYNYRDKDKFNYALEKMTHRGPDSYGIEIVNDKVILGHKRLSILDLSSNGNQPMKDTSGRYTIIYNGEVYNFKELKSELQDYPFESESDTEVLLALFLKYAGNMVHKLRGIFAFSIYDSLKDELYLFRDRLGVKPLYYYYENNEFIFSSEIRSLKSLANNMLTPDYNGYYSFLKMGAVINPVTFFKEIKILPPGCSMKLSGNTLKIENYYTIDYTPNNYSYQENVKRTRELLDESVKYRLVSDLPVGAFLSGGIDSSAIVALMRTHTKGSIETFSIDFNEKEFSEGNIAKQVAKKFETNHHHFVVKPNDLKKEFYNILDSIDSPSIDGINTYFVSKFAKEQGMTVVMSGLGGDEVFGGYGSFESFPKMKSLKTKFKYVPKSIFELLKKFPNDIKIQRLLEYLSSNKNINIDTYLLKRSLFSDKNITNLSNTIIDNEHYYNLLEKDFVNREFYSVENIVSYLHTKLYMGDQLLRDSDVMSMRHSLELRVPLVDHELISFGATIPGKFKHNKMVLLDAVKELLPSDVYERKKQGFGFPLDKWMKNKELSSMIKELLFLENEYLNKNEVEKLWKQFEQNKVSWSRVWAIVVFNYYLLKRN